MQPINFFYSKNFSISENNDSEAFYKTSFILAIVFGKNNRKKRRSFRIYFVPLGSKNQNFHIYFFNSIKNSLKKKEVSCEISNIINVDINISFYSSREFSYYLPNKYYFIFIIIKYLSLYVMKFL